MNRLFRVYRGWNVPTQFYGDYFKNLEIQGSLLNNQYFIKSQGPRVFFRGSIGNLKSSNINSWLLRVWKGARLWSQGRIWKNPQPQTEFPLGFDQHILVEALQILDEINSGHGTWYKYIWFWIQFLPSLNSTTFLSPIDFKLVHFTTWKASNLPKIERCASRFFPNKNWSRHLDLNWSCPGNTPISGQMVACFWAVSMSDRFLKCSYHIRSPGGEGLMGGILSKISSLVNFTFP